MMSQTLLCLLGLVLAAVEAKKKTYRTDTFRWNAEDQPHDSLEDHIPGLVIGFAALGIFYIVVLVMIIKDEIARNGKYQKDLDD